MKKILSVFLLLAMTTAAAVATEDSIAPGLPEVLIEYFEIPSTNNRQDDSYFFREWMQTGDLNNYLNYFADDILWEGETTGQWTLPERMLFSIRGNSYEWNRFYLDGFRLDSRFMSGSMFYVPDMKQTSIRTDMERGAIHLTTDARRPNQLWMEGNMGGVGGVSPGTQQMINVMHQTAQQRAFGDLSTRSHMIGAGQLSLGYGIPTAYGDSLYQRLYMNAGARSIAHFDTDGIAGAYVAPFYKVQLAGKLPMSKRAFEKGWSLHYLFDMQHRTDFGTELGYGIDEVAEYEGSSLSVYTTHKAKTNEDYSLTTGLTYALHKTQHQNQSFERNVVDVDGEGFDPWNADGRLHEMSWAVNYVQRVWASDNAELNVSLDSYNSLLHFSPRTDAWSNQVYCQFQDSAREDWYSYDFSSSAFTAGMLENTWVLEYNHCTPNGKLHASMGLTYDALLMRDRYVGLPSWEAELSYQYEPTRWFDMEVLLGHYRTKYTWNQLRLLSQDYQNGTISGPNAPYSNYGGAYLDVARGLQQSQYAALEIPFSFHVGRKTRHDFVCLLSARLYYHMWEIAGNPNYGVADGARPYIMQEQQPVAGAGMFALPLYLSNTLRYTYTGKKVFFSLSWQSYQMSGKSTLGNGAENNSIGSLSYSMLSPAASENLKDAESSVKMLHRLDQDKAYICRIQLGANITPNWQLMMNGHWQDGTPISNYIVKDGLVYTGDTKGINPKDMHFGKRKDMFFNIDMKLGYRGNINRRDQTLGLPGAVPFSVDLTCYNIYDFGTEWYEYSFDQNLEHIRRSLSVCIPRGLMLRFSVGLTPNK